MTPYYQHGGVTIYHGDAREIVPTLGAACVDLVLTDPPFFMPANVQNCRRQWRRSLGDTAIMASFFRDCFEELAQSLRPTGGFYTFSDATSFAIFTVVCYPLFDRTQAIVWDKGSGGTGNGWRHCTEFILHGAFKDTIYAPGFRVDLLRAKRVPSEKRWHQSEKPADAILPLLQAHPTGRVLDPFMGGGSTLRAAKDLGWQAVGIDIDEANCEEAAKRMEQATLSLGGASPCLSREEPAR